MDLLSYGAGIVTALLAVSPVLGWAWRTHRRDQDYQLAQRVSGMVKSILDARDAADPDRVPATTGRPSHRRDGDEAVLMKFATARQALDDFEQTLIYVKEHGGHPDDAPAKVIAAMKGKGNK